MILYPINNSRGSLSHYLIIDPDQPENVTVPHYPQESDVARLNSPEKIKLVSSVDADNETSAAVTTQCVKWVGVTLGRQ